MKENYVYFKDGWSALRGKSSDELPPPSHLEHMNVYKARSANVIICYYCPCHNIFTWNEFFLDKFFSRTLQDPQPRKNPLLKLTKTAFLLIQER